MQGKRGTGHRKVFKAFQVIAFVMLIAIPTMTAFSSETVLKTSSKEFLAKVLVLDRTVEKHPLDLGVYTSGPLQTTAQELGQIDAWMESQGLASRVQIAGTFMDIEFPNPAYNVIRDLDAAWDQGTAPFVNLAVGTTDVGPRSAAQVANGEIDAAIRTWAAVFSQWSQGGAKRAYIAPLQEMNADWVSYGLDPENYIAAYTRIQRIFNEEGVTAEAVTWVFAPNGWSMPEHAFENYYPAEARVDMIAFSGFNFGACADNIDPWQEYAEAIQPYVHRMQDMAPGKPILVAQIGSVTEGGDQGSWLVETLGQLSRERNVVGFIYFNVAKHEAGAVHCPVVDWRVFDPQSNLAQNGLLAAMQSIES